MADLAGGHYPQQYAFGAVPFGGATNVANTVVPPRSNLEYLGFSTITDGAMPSTGISFAVPVAVDVGTTISAVTIFVGATAASLPTHSFAALYAGIAGVSGQTLIGQSTDGATGAVAASAAYKFTLTTPANITAAQAPNGWIYAAVCITATTMNTVLSVAVPSAAQYAYFTGSPTFLSATTGSGQAATAAAFSGTAKVVAPLVVLT